jgi:hypothetical protein
VQQKREESILLLDKIIILMEKKERYYTGKLKKYLSSKKFLPRHKERRQFHTTSILDKDENKTALDFVLQNILLKLYFLRF